MPSTRMSAVWGQSIRFFSSTVWRSGRTFCPRFHSNCFHIWLCLSVLPACCVYCSSTLGWLHGVACALLCSTPLASLSCAQPPVLPDMLGSTTHRVLLEIHFATSTVFYCATVTCWSRLRKDRMSQPAWILNVGHIARHCCKTRTIVCCKLFLWRRTER